MTAAILLDANARGVSCRTYAVVDIALNQVQKVITVHAGMIEMFIMNAVSVLTPIVLKGRGSNVERETRWVA